MTLASVEVMPAVYERLAPGETIDAELASAGFTGVFALRGVPDGQPFDYITISGGRTTPNNTFGRKGYNTFLVVTLWSRQLGTKNATIAAGRICDLLDQQKLPLPSQKHVSTMLINHIENDEKDGLTLRVVLQFRIYSEE